MSGVAMANPRCTATFLEMRCALAVEHAMRHSSPDGDRVIQWGWADDPEYAGMTFDYAIDVIGPSGETLRQEVIG